jgi:hypothetical protein
MCHIYYQSIIKGVEKQTCPISIGTTKLDLDASCNENGPSLFSDPTPCFLIPIIVKCIKFMIMEAQTFLDSSTLACFIDKDLVQQYKLALLEKNTLVLVEAINGQILSSRLVTPIAKASCLTWRT